MLGLEPPPATSRRARTAGATWLSAGVHVAVAVIVVIVTQRSGGPSDSVRQVPSATPFVWLERVSDPGGSRTDGGRDYGDRTQQPPPAAQRTGADPRTVPTVSPRSFDATESPVEAPQQQIVVPVVPEASGLRDIPGSVSVISVSGIQGGGPGSDRGAGEGEGGTGLGRGPGHYEGLGPGSGANLTPPELIRQVRPNYTSAALQARVRGIVVMDVVVLGDGSVGEVKIVRSLDPTFGLDHEAIKAVRQWRFRAGTRAGEPVSMLVTVEMMFELR